MNPKQLLQQRMDGKSLRSTAKDIGVSAAYLSDVMLGKRGFGPKILNYLGLEKRVTIVEKYELASTVPTKQIRSNGSRPRARGRAARDIAVTRGCKT